jgi:hypothetical protein
MGLSRLPVVVPLMPSPLRMCRRRLSALQNHWLGVLWRRLSIANPHHPQTSPTLHSPSQSIVPHRAASLSSNRATGSIRPTRFTRIYAGTARVFRRWMLPTVERGPPVLNSV